VNAVDPARSFDRAAEEYERGRPGYPDALLDLLPIASVAVVVDLGAGTGKLTRVLARRYARVIAVEPLNGMRSILERAVPAAEGRVGSAEAIPLACDSVDAVFAGQAFHWFAHDEAVAEIARVLRPSGVLALVWNESSDLHPSPLPDAYRRRFAELEPERGRELDPTWREPIERGPFGAIESASVEHEQLSDRETILAFAASVSIVARRPEDERRTILDELAALLPPGAYTFPLRADVNWTVRA